MPATAAPRTPEALGTGAVRTLLELTRIRITWAVTLTAGTGYLLASGRLDIGVWMPLLGVFLLASGSSALNQCQEARIDARMQRTCRRPIPSGRIDLAKALFVAGLLILLGLFVLSSVPNNLELALSLGVAALVWYNGVYTYLKRLTAFAVVPGALIGAIPPVIGYVAGGGEATDPVILLVAGFFFIWQIPHFWLLLMMFGHQYGQAGLPTLTQVFSPPQLARITFMWVLATAVSGLVFPTVSRADLAIPWSLVVVLGSIWLAAKATELFRPVTDSNANGRFRKAFVQINVYALLVIVCLSLNAVWGPTG
jgi:protoheme IX farnesyltransferase